VSQACIVNDRVQLAGLDTTTLEVSRQAKSVRPRFAYIRSWTMRARSVIAVNAVDERYLRRPKLTIDRQPRLLDKRILA
jgi:hypothetical protein